MTESILFRKTRAFSLRNEHIQAVLLKAGGKIASLKKDGNEYLYQGHSKEFTPSQFEGDFGSCDLSGFDDMVPTINAGYIQSGVFSGVHMADHGEVWAVDWDVEEGTDEITASADGVRLPYRISKTLTLKENVLIINYELRNKSPFSFPCMWAAHMLINADENTRFASADSINGIRASLDMSSALNGFGALHEWPQTKDKHGRAYYLDRLGTRDSKVCEKYYFDSRLKTGEIRVENPAMKIRFDAETIPYLGIWLNSNGYKDQYNIGIEPASAPMDSPENAKQWGYSAELQGGACMRWKLEIEV
ncbi:MAG: hypothetical protein LBJ31_03945 [Treponema sp.]|jgi:galactose mutarotase-like enzyme|nr:hypothetical protein [Treponema sp.]